MGREERKKKIQSTKESSLLKKKSLIMYRPGINTIRIESMRQAKNCLKLNMKKKKSPLAIIWTKNSILINKEGTYTCVIMKSGDSPPHSSLKRQFSFFGHRWQMWLKLEEEKNFSHMRRSSEGDSFQDMKMTAGNWMTHTTMTIFQILKDDWGRKYSVSIRMMFPAHKRGRQLSSTIPFL